MSVKIDNQIDYKPIEYHHGTLRYQKFQPESGQSNGTITASGFESLFKIPAICFNFAKSILEFDATIPVQTVGFDWVHKECLSFVRQMQVYTASGTMLADIRNVHNYTKIQWLLEPTDEYLEYDTFGNALGAGRLLRRNNNIAGQAGAATVNYAAKPYPSYTNANPPVAALMDTTASYLEKQYVECSAAAMNLMIRLPLEMIRNSILSMNKSFYFGEPVYLRIYWAPTYKIAFQGTTQNQPYTAVQAITGSISLSNIQIMIAEEMDPSICNQLMEKAKNGYSFLMPWVENTMVPLSGTLQTVIVPVTKAYGKRLLRAIYSPFNPTEQFNTAYDNHLGLTSTAATFGQLTIQSCWSTIDGQRIEPFNVNILEYEDWALIKNKLKGGIVFDSQIYRANWFWVSDFCKISPPSQINDLEYNEEKGIDLNKERVLNMTIQGDGTAFNWYVYLITQREVHIKGNRTTVH